MNRLQAELQRLYLPPDTGRDAGAPEHWRLADSGGPTRAMVLELAGPAGWAGLSAAWQGVQADLQLPAPGIAVSGRGHQLWFSLAEPVPAAAARAFLDALRRRYLGEIVPDRVATFRSQAPSSGDAPAAGRLPPFEARPGHWSAFVTADLAALFEDEAWLDLPPGPDAQADLLSRLQATDPADWQRALERLAPAAPDRSADAVNAAAATAAPQQDPRRFLLEVMNDRTVDMRLRIEAARALLSCGEGQRRLD